MTSERKSAFLSRLAQDTAGNTLAIMAAAFFPLAGLIGGGVDMTRIYITKTRLQQACDAGALSGRKAMGSGAWSTAAGGSRDQAYALFAANFQEGDFGTSGMTREFTESDGTVTGTATAEVPMTLMRIFGQEARTVSVSCTAKMEIPNTDVMFVLDVTSSMNCEPGCAYSATEQSDAKIGDLRSAVNCFYEALLKVNTTEDCSIPAGQPGGPQTDPTATTYSGTAQIRLGVVPYAVNVNVGKLLPHDRIADSWLYQTRQAYTKTVHTWAPAGSPTAPSSWGSWSGNPPSDADRLDRYSSTWTVVSGADSDMTTMSSGSSFRKKLNSGTTPRVDDNGECTALNSWSDENDLVGIQWSDGAAGSTSYTAGAAPTWSATPPTTQAMNASRSRTETITYGFKYRWHKNGTTTNACWLEYAAKNNTNKTFSQTQSATTTRPITWTDLQEFDKYNYNQASLNVSGLKGSGTSWNGTVSIANLGTTTGATVYRSGDNSTSTLTVPAPATVEWDGCIEELATFQNTDGNPADDWAPVPTTALDLKIDPPAGAQWGPLLDEAFWGRYTGSSTSNRTRDLVQTATNLNRNMSSGISSGYYCPQEARKLAEYTTPASFVNYINGLQANAIGTYHDIGLIWGARLISPTGIFASENAFTADGGAIERHLIFMTDGSAQTYENNLYAYGSAFWDRRQTSYDPATSHLTSLVNARTEAICTLIKNMNIKLWVISYGGGVSEDDEDRLETCASPGQYFSSTNRAALISQFKQIASEIADLRLTE